MVAGGRLFVATCAGEMLCLDRYDGSKLWSYDAGEDGGQNFHGSLLLVDELLFAGTEFAVYYSLNGGEKWIKISGLPTISVRDIEIQERENDLVLATFGRGFYVLDDYSPLQHVTAEILEKPAHIFPIKDALFYMPSSRGRTSRSLAR